MQDGQAALAAMGDELAIRRQIALFADAAMSDDRDAFCALFTAEGEFSIEAPANLKATGRAEIGDLLGRLRDGQDFFVQYAQPGRIEVRGDQAVARTLCYEMARGPGAHYYRNHGLFFDRLVRSDAGWLFASRRYAYLWLDASPFSGTAFPQLDVLAAHADG